MDIPLDIWVEILLRVPADKQLLKLKRVCKSWYKVITDNHFIRRNLNRCRHRGGNLIIRPMLHHINSLNYDFYDDTSKPLLSSSFVRRCENLLYASDYLILSCYEIFDSCNGLLFILLTSNRRPRDYEYQYFQHLLVFNPITMSHRLLELSRHNGGTSEICYRFSKVIYDASSGYYKIFRLSHSCLSVDGLCCSVREFHESGSGLSQVRIITTLEERFIWHTPLHKSISVEGKVHWLIFSASEMWLLSVDIATSDFVFTPTCCCPGVIETSHNFGASSDKFYYFKPVSSNELELWVLKDLDQNPSWVVQRRIKSGVPELDFSKQWRLVKVLHGNRKMIVLTESNGGRRTRTTKVYSCDMMISDDNWKQINLDPKNVASKWKRFRHGTFDSFFHVNSLISFGSN